MFKVGDTVRRIRGNDYPEVWMLYNGVYIIKNLTENKRKFQVHGIDIPRYTWDPDNFEPIKEKKCHWPNWF